MTVRLQHRFSTIMLYVVPGRALIRSVAVVMLLAPQVLWAFGGKAHRIVGHVAEYYICPETRTALDQLMPDFSLAEAGVWADKVRGYPDWAYTKPWHYINVADGVPLNEASRSDAGDVLAAIDRFNAELTDGDLTDEQRLVAFYFLVHFVADVHQPLHVGRQSDLGGNRVNVRVNDRQMNLHVYWDSFVLSEQTHNEADYAWRLATRNVPAAATWQTSEPLVWAVESQALRPDVYDFAAPATKGRQNLDAVYQARARRIVDLRLAQAGIRLAGLLNRIWCPGYEAGENG